MAGFVDNHQGDESQAHRYIARDHGKGKVIHNCVTSVTKIKAAIISETGSSDLEAARFIRIIDAEFGLLTFGQFIFSNRSKESIHEFLRARDV